MSSLAAALLAQTSSNVQTRQALIVTGLQNDFINPTGKLPMHTDPGLVDRIRQLVPAFREHGDVIWVWTEYQGNRTVNDPTGSGCMVIVPDPDDDGTSSSGERGSTSGTSSARSMNSTVQRARQMAAELDLISDDGSEPTEDPEEFLTETPLREACCKPGTWGAKPIPEIEDLISPRDMHVTKTYYSAFRETSLLLQLRAKLITDLYFAGCNTNLSVYATATDVARYGLQINLIEDCLGCRQRNRHDEAVRKMVSCMGAEVTSARTLLGHLRGEHLLELDESSATSGSEASTDSQEHFPLGYVRPSHFISHHSQDPILRAGAVPFPIATRPASIEYAESDGLEPDADSFSSSSDRTEKGWPKAATPTDEFRRERIGATKGLTDSDTSDIEACLQTLDLGLTEATARTNEDENGGVKGTMMTHDMSAGSATLPSLSRYSLQHSRGVPPIHTIPTSTGPWESAADTTTQSASAQFKPAKKKGWRRVAPTLGPGAAIGSGDSSIVYDLLPPVLADVMFQQLLREVHWQRMYHAAGEVPRLVCCQGSIDPTDGSMPVYRHPSDHTLPLLHWSPGVARVKREAENRVGHKLNHVLIQLYRSGQDHISEHSDKTLDIVPGSYVANVSFGAQRTMRLRTKRAASGVDGPTPTRRRKSDIRGPPDGSSNATSTTTVVDGNMPGPQRTTQRIHMPHNSMFIMGLETNAVWLHGITPDKRLHFDRSAAELAYGGMRISLTFRYIGTYLSSDSRLIWGQGATGKQKEKANTTISGVETESQALVDAFGTENQSTNFDWSETYGSGFDTLHLKSPVQDQQQPIVFLSGNEHLDLAVKLYLAHLGVLATEIPSSTPDTEGDVPLRNAAGEVLPPSPVQRSICFRDTDPLHTQVCGEAAILLYLDRAYARYLMSTAPAMLMQAARELELLTCSLLPEMRDLLKQAAVDRELVGEHLKQVLALRDLDDFLAECRSDQFGDGGAAGLVTVGTGTGTLSSVRREETNSWLAGKEFGIADCAFWSLIQAFRALFIERFARVFPSLNAWAMRVQARDEVGKLRRGGGGVGGGGNERRASEWEVSPADEKAQLKAEMNEGSGS